MLSFHFISYSISKQPNIIKIILKENWGKSYTVHKVLAEVCKFMMGSPRKMAVWLCWLLLLKQQTLTIVYNYTKQQILSSRYPIELEN